MAFRNLPRDKYAFYGNSGVGAALATSAGAEDAMGAIDWLIEPEGTFFNGRTYEIKLRCPIYGSPGAAVGLSTLRVRKGSAVVAPAQQLAFFRADFGAFAANVEEAYRGSAYVKNVSGQDITTKLSLTIQRVSGADSVNIFGNSDLPVVLTVEDVGDTNIAVAQLSTSITP